MRRCSNAPVFSPGPRPAPALRGVRRGRRAACLAVYRALPSRWRVGTAGESSQWGHGRGAGRRRWARVKSGFIFPILLPGYGAVLFVRAMVAHPAGYGPLLAHHTEKPLLPSGTSGPWASGKVRGFGAACPMAHPFACLRITEAISDAGARLATGSGGLTLGRAGCAPTGRHTTFHEGIASSSPN
jgi:hypothetical protein